jgi:ferric-dicitrate binding protein FerR (iron transport regulator)
MTKNFQYVEDVLADEAFLAWYFDHDQESVSAWKEWLALHPESQALVNEATVFMNNLPQQEIAVSKERVEGTLQKLYLSLLQDKAPVVEMKPLRKRWWIGAAAAILIIIGSLTFLKFNPSRPVLDTPYGQISTNQLPDGSTMILNANSTAKLSEGWKDGKDREVWLDGEAFFKVTKTLQKSRFIVHTGNLDVIVTGTQFNVLHRENKTTVLLTEGSVILRTSDGKELAMKPGDYVVMDDKAVETKPVKEEDVLAWKDNRLSFDNTSLKEVAQIIHNHYGVRVTLADDEVAGQSLTGIMPNNNLDILLKAIEMGTSIKIDRTDKEIVFSSK